jgi:hypothetical protein
MLYIESLIKSAGIPPHSPLGNKPTSLEEIECRKKEANRLTHLLESSTSFSFLRIGDNELFLLLAFQANETPETNSNSYVQTGTRASGGPGISLKHGQRFWNAYCNASYVDYYDRIWPNTKLLPKLQLNRPSILERNPDYQTSIILYTWVEFEFQSYCERHRVGFVGAESSTLQKLSIQKEFLESSGSIWPRVGEQFFLQPKENGSNLDRNLDLIKEEIRAFVVKNKIDTLFISLGGAAKILCYELAKELNIRCFDFGAALRALCYLGSIGHKMGRSAHSLFYYRLKFNTVMDAIEAAYPNLNPSELMAKAHAQLILELQKKEAGWTYANWEYDFNSENLMIFHQSFKAYKKRFKSHFRYSPETIIERARFLHFCGTHKLTWEGRVFIAVFHAKVLARKIINMMHI